MEEGEIEIMKQPLEGVKVLDLSRTLAGPYCTMLLGDMGADVIKVEQPGAGDETRRFTPPAWNGIATYYFTNNRNKRGITVDLKSPEGKEIIYKLAEKADVFVENFRTGAMDKLGFGYEKLEKSIHGLFTLLSQVLGGQVRKKTGQAMMFYCKDTAA